MHRTWILGASDPEMDAIDRLLRDAGETVEYARSQGGQRVSPFEAYRAVPLAGFDPEREAVVVVECFIPGMLRCQVVDHHRIGDPGFGAGPDRYWEASSIGQACSILGVEPTPGLRMVAAADHCLAAAYAGLCDGVSPVALARWRAESRAAFQHRPVAAVLADIEAAGAIIEAAPFVAIGPSLVRDLRGKGIIPELPEALVQLGEVVVADAPPDHARPGDAKMVIQGAGAGTTAGTAPIAAFLGGWAAGEGYVDQYGDPARGFAGAFRRGAP